MDSFGTAGLLHGQFFDHICDCMQAECLDESNIFSLLNGNRVVDRPCNGRLCMLIMFQFSAKLTDLIDSKYASRIKEAVLTYHKKKALQSMQNKRGMWRGGEKIERRRKTDTKLLF